MGFSEPRHFRSFKTRPSCSLLPHRTLATGTSYNLSSASYNPSGPTRGVYFACAMTRYKPQARFAYDANIGAT